MTNSIKKPSLSAHKVAGDAFLDICGPEIRAFYKLWLSKVGDRPVPRRRDLPPEEMRRFLAGVAIVEYEHETDQLIYRLMGTRGVAVRGGIDPTGKPVREHFHGDGWEDVWENYSFVIENQCPLYDPSDAPSPSGNRVDDETLFLPIDAERAGVTQVLVFSVQRWPFTSDIYGA